MLYKNILKAVIDYCGAVFILILVSPVLFFITCILLLANKGKVFFIQPRPGKNGKVFRIFKFRTMNDKRDSNGNLLPDNKRITFVGHLLRNTSLDELPQLLNVVKGDLSFIGPRPLLTDYLPLYNNFQRRRHEVKPGITGWAQVNGRNELTWNERFKMDIWYIDNLSFSLDCKIVFLTLIKVINRKGVSSKNYVTMERFSGE